MQVSVEKTKNKLERRLHIKVPAERIDTEVDKRLRSIGKRAKLDGFRPGKAPYKVIAQQYGHQVREEVLGEVIQSSTNEALVKEKLNPASPPRIEDSAKATDGGLAFTATIEIYPEISLKPYKKVKVERPAVEIGEADVDKVIETLRKQRATWNAVDRVAADGDQVTVDFTGRIDGEVFEGGTGSQVPVVLGEGRFLAGFEHNLAGATAGETREFDLDFPQDYANDTLAGKTARFTVEVKAVSVRVLPQVDDDFCRSFNVQEGGIVKLRADVRENMARELKRAVRSRIKQQVLEGLLSLHKVELPKSLVHEEIHRLKHEAAQRMGIQDEKQTHDLPEALFEEQAQRRVSLGLLIAEIIRSEDIKLDQARVNATIGEIAATYDEPQRVIEAYRANREMMDGVKAMVMEEQVVDRVLEDAKVTDKAMKFDEIMNPEREAGGK